MNCCLHIRYQAFEKIPKDSVLFRTLQTKVNARGKFTYISVEKNSTIVSQRLPSNPVGQSHRREPSMLKHVPRSQGLYAHVLPIALHLALVPLLYNG